MNFAWIKQVNNRQVLLPLFILGLIFIISAAMISQQVDRAIQSYQDAYLFLSANEYLDQFNNMTTVYRTRLKVLAIRPEVGEGQFVIRSEGNSEPLGKILRQEMASNKADHIRAIDRNGQLLFEQGLLNFDPGQLLADRLASIQAHPPIKNPQNQLDEVVHSQLVYVNNQFYLLTVAPLLDVEDITGVIILVHSLNDHLLAALRDKMDSYYLSGSAPFHVSLTTSHKVVHSTFDQNFALTFPALFPQPFDQPVAGYAFRHTPIAIQDSPFYLILSFESSILDTLHTIIRSTLMGVFITVLVMLLIIILFNVRQISLQQQARDLRERETRFRRLADAALEGIVFSEGAHIRDANLAFADIFGYPIAQLINRAVLDLVAPEEKEWVTEKLRSSSKELYEVICLRQDNSRFIAEVRSRQIEYCGRDVLVTAVRDITQRKWAEQQLQEAKEQAEQAYQKLKSTQTQLVQAEKFASLGELVAGVAHEINTPVGIGVTGASYLASETQRVRQLFENNTLRKMDFREYIYLVETTSNLLLVNMERASGLIKSFKQVAVDRSSSERRSFNVRAYLDEILLSLHPHLKKTSHRVEISGEETILADSYPGALAQILTNLVINALIHAFGEETQQNGLIQIRMQQFQKDMVQVTLSDNGQGIPPENIAKIFDPFFTTRRGSGGSGLGLNISFLLAHQTLGGMLYVSSQVGVGTTFTLQFPRVAPLSSETVKESASSITHTSS